MSVLNSLIVDDEELARRLVLLREPPAVILTTAYSDYALEGFELDVVDYLLKPFSFERFVRAVSKARDYRFPPDSGTRPGTGVPAYLLVQADRKTYRVAYEDILYIESLREYVAYHTPKGRIVALGSLKQLEEELPPGFLRVHKSFIVATDKVEVLDGNQLHIGAALIPIGGSYREAVKGRLFDAEP